MVIDNEYGRDGAICSSGRVWGNTLEPGGICCDVVDGGEIDVPGIGREAVERVQVIEGQLGWGAGKRGEV